MNSDQAKSILITDLLTSLSREPRNIKNNECWYLSPLHEEKTPSFKVDTVKNVWFDHGAGVGGNIIDLVMNIYNLDFKLALQKLSSIFIYNDTAVNSFSFHQQGIKQKINKIQEFAKSQTKDPGQSHFELKKVKALENKALLEYITKRGIKSDIAVQYLKEIYYNISNPDNTDKKNDWIQSKTYFALGFKNDADNYELRNAYFKGCIGSKDITTIKGAGNKELSIFEGFMDFLSALTHFKIDKFKSDVIILNSVANKAKISDLLYSDLYNKIYLFLDNDKAGEETQREFYSINDKCVNCSTIYKAHKDFNEFING